METGKNYKLLIELKNEIYNVLHPIERLRLKLGGVVMKHKGVVTEILILQKY